MEKLTLTPQCHEIIVNNGSLDGAVDLFSYGPDTAADLKPLGSIYVVGHRDTDSSNMGYMVSLIAALARREYYAEPGVSPRDAFSRTLHKVNEVVEEFFQSSGLELSVGIFAIAGANIFVSKLDKFKILLARDGQVIDILNNVMLFQKEHLQKRQFSSIISGTVQPGDRILAYYPSKAVTSRERFLKSYLLKLPLDQIITKINDIGRQNATFAAAMLYVDMAQTAKPALTEPRNGDLDIGSPAEMAKPEPTMPRKQMDEQSPTVNLAWTPRQSRSLPVTFTPATERRPYHEPEPHLTAIEAEPEVPHLIPTEFSLGTRRGTFSRWLNGLRVVRLDARGKAIFLASAVILLVISVLVAKSIFFTSPEEKQFQEAIKNISNDVQSAQQDISVHDGSTARQILVRALSALGSYSQDRSEVRNLSASILKTMDDLDHAQDATPTLVVQLDADTDKIVLTAWASSSQSVWAVTTASDKYALVKITGGVAGERVQLGDVHPTQLIPFKSGALIIDSIARQITRIIKGQIKTFTIPTQDKVIAATQYDDNLFVLTDSSILKITDLDTDKPVTKQWLANAGDLASDAAGIFIDGNVRLMGHDGVLTTYYKGKKTGQVQTPLTPSGAWELVPSANGQLAIANADNRRVYEFDITSGALTKTLKVDSQVAFVQMTAGPDGSIFFVTKDNKLWRIN